MGIRSIACPTLKQDHQRELAAAWLNTRSSDKSYEICGTFCQNNPMPGSQNITRAQEEPEDIPGSGALRDATAAPH